ncbi:GLPGLI family protein [Soonwooa sp.]|uniref:GLPGLI family protein n=1 Tax=Soonwooa sp. TaxID=1938592 RepID=UPI00262B8F67|nr:GLPGLI family protein [Soonwooa sp.]
MKTKITISFLVILLANLCFAQSYKIIYELQWKPDSKADKTETELTTLLTTKDGVSYFESYDLFRADSTKTKAILDMRKRDDGQLRFPTMKDDSKFRELVVKDFKNKKFLTERKFYNKAFSIDYNCPMKWKISDEKSKLFGYNIQKAELNFGGRSWTAWFTNEIPIADGPYKFYGLPGLILKISDKTNDYKFEIVGITKEENNISERHFGDGSPAKVNLTQWDKFWKEYKKQPSMILANLNTAQTTYVIDGKDVNDKDVKASFDKKEKALMAYFENNPIELNSTCQ